jgi:opacity protein-like surface antigen
MNKIFSQKFILCFLMVVSGYSVAKNNDSIALGLFNEPEGDRAGAEIVGTLKSDYFGGKLGGVLYSSKRHNSNGNEENEIYGGLSAFAFVHFGQEINPYLGVGVFIGQGVGCDDSNSYYDDDDNCKNRNEVALYPELGVEIHIEKVTISPYIRRYFDSSTSNKSGNVYGVTVGISF